MQRNDRKPPTIKDVAARAGVSVMTASRAINGKALVSPSARQAVALVPQMRDEFDWNG